MNRLVLSSLVAGTLMSALAVEARAQFPMPVYTPPPASPFPRLPVFQPPTWKSQPPLWQPGTWKNQPPLWQPGTWNNQPPIWQPGTWSNGRFEPGRFMPQMPIFQPGQFVPQPPIFQPGQFVPQPPIFQPGLWR